MKRQFYILLLAISTCGYLYSMRFFKSNAPNSPENLLQAIKADKQDKVISILGENSALLNAALTMTDDKDWKKSKITPLMAAAKYDRPEIIDLLVAKGADLNKTNDSGRTAVHFAAWYGNEEALEKLMQYEADVTISDYKQMTPLMLAAENGKINSASLLLQHAGVDKHDGKGKTALIYAVRNKQAAMAEFLIGYGANVDVEVFDAALMKMMTPLRYAARNDDSKMGKILLKAGAKLDESSYPQGASRSFEKLMNDVALERAKSMDGQEQEKKQPQSSPPKFNPAWLDEGSMKEDHDLPPKYNPAWLDEQHAGVIQQDEVAPICQPSGQYIFAPTAPPLSPK